MIATSNNYFFQCFNDMQNAILDECLEKTVKDKGNYPSIEMINRCREHIKELNGNKNNVKS